MADRGYDAVSIEEIARAAGLGKGTVLAHFSEKLAILAAFHAERLAEVASIVRDLPLPAAPAQLAQALWPLVAALCADPACIRLATAEATDPARQDLAAAEAALRQEVHFVLKLSGHDHPQLAGELVEAALLHVALAARARFQSEGRTVALVQARRRLADLLTLVLREPL